MKDRYPKAIQSIRNRTPYGDYMLQSRTGSGSADIEPMTIEYDSNYQSQSKMDVAEPEVPAIEETYKEEFMLLESGNFVLSAPSVAIWGTNEERDEPPLPEVYEGLGRNRTESFEADFPGIEKTYTTFVNVAEDQIYPLELKYFLEAALDDGAEPVPKQKNVKKLSSRRTMVANYSKSTNTGDKTSISTSTTTKAAKTTAVSQDSALKLEEKDSDSLNSESKKFRLFPNLRDVATRRNRRIEAVRQRLVDGRKRDKKEKNDKSKQEKNENTNISTTNTGAPSVIKKIQTEEEATPSIYMESTLKAINANSKTATKTPVIEGSHRTSPTDNEATPAIQIPAIENARATSPVNNDVALRELAEKILGTEIPKSEVSVYDFTKNKRKKKSKKTAVINGSTSFPVLSSPDMSWDIPKSTIASQDDNLVTYDTNTDAAKNDVTNAHVVAHGVEAVYSVADEDVQGFLMTVEKTAGKPFVSDIGQKLSNDKSTTTFALSQSFDDAYHSSIVQSIKEEIVTIKPLPVLNVAPQTDYSVAAASDPPIQQDFKWFNFGRQQKQQQTNTDVTMVVQEPHIADDRNDVPSISDARSALDIAIPPPVTEPYEVKKMLPGEIVRGLIEVNPEPSEIMMANAPPDCNMNDKSVGRVSDTTDDNKSLEQDVNKLPDEYESFNSVRYENNDDNLSVITDRSEKVVSNFVNSFRKLLSLFGKKVSDAVTCSPVRTKRATMVEGLTILDADDESIVVNEEKVETPQFVQVQKTHEESLLSSNGTEALVEELLLSSNGTEAIVEEEKLHAVQTVTAAKQVTPVTLLPRKTSSLDTASRLSSKTFDSDGSDTAHSDDDENITTTSTGTFSEWEDGVKTHWCSCT